jgi:two-component system response regulator MprA
MDRQPTLDVEIIKRVLVVDDDQDVRGLLQDLLEERGYQVATAADGAQAVAFLTHATEPWIVLLDVVMPQLSGLEVCAHLHANGATAPDHRVALMTELWEKVKHCPPPARALLRKPFDVDAVLNLVAVLAQDHA